MMPRVFFQVLKAYDDVGVPGAGQDLLTTG
jgi:hypothetical protein